MKSDSRRRFAQRQEGGAGRKEQLRMVPGLQRVLNEPREMYDSDGQLAIFVSLHDIVHDDVTPLVFLCGPANRIAEICWAGTWFYQHPGLDKTAQVCPCPAVLVGMDSMNASSPSSFTSFCSREIPPLGFLLFRCPIEALHATH